MTSINPFTNIAGINGSELFINRTDLVSELLNSLLADSSQCRSVIGQRKIGKTSILQHVINCAQNFDAPVKNMYPIFVFLDCQLNDEALDSVESFYLSLLDLLYESAPLHIKKVIKESQISKDGNAAWKTWREILKILKTHNTKVVVIFDEFDKAIFRRNLHAEGLFGSLRSLPQAFSNFVWVTSTHRQLRDLFKEAWQKYDISKDQQRVESEFYNIAPTINISLFDSDAIDKLISEPSALAGVQFTQEDIINIKRLGGFFPYYVQRACYHFFNNHIRHNERIDLIVQDYLQEVIPLWEDLWEIQNDRSKKIITAIAYDKDTKAGIIEVNELIAASLVCKDNNQHLSLFSEEFSSFIQRKNQRYESIIRVDDWVDNDRYQIRSLVDDTPSSQVVKAWDERWGNIKAIKFVRIGDDRSEGTIQRLQKTLRREAQILFNLSHPSIGKIWDITDEPIGIVMEWVDGCSLKEFIDPQKRLSTEKVVDIGIQTADALAYIHNLKNPVIHRDIKPANIIYTMEQKIKLIDFGIAHDVYVETISKSHDGTKFQIGTPRYSSPEQLILDDIGPESDIFSLGVVLYELLTLDKPYRYGNRLSQYGDRFPKPEQHDIPGPLYEILCNMLDGKNSNRPTAEELQRELRECFLHSRNST